MSPLSLLVEVRNEVRLINMICVCKLLVESMRIFLNSSRLHIRPLPREFESSGKCSMHRHIAIT